MQQDDAEDVIVEPIPRAAAKRRNYQQRAHSTSTFDAAPGQPVVQPILYGRRNQGSDSSLHRYASGLGSSRDLDENERSSYSSPMPPAHQQQPPRVLRTLSQSYQQNTTSDRVLSEQIFHFHHTVEQPQQLLNRKLHLRDMIYYAISPIFPMCGLYIVGSPLNGFGNAKSDMDLGLMITNKDLDQRTDAVVVLSSIKRALQDVKITTRMQMILADGADSPHEVRLPVRRHRHGPQSKQLGRHSQHPPDLLLLRM